MASVQPVKPQGTSAPPAAAAAVGAATLRHATSTAQGGRPYQEDRYVAVQDLNELAAQYTAAQLCLAPLRGRLQRAPACAACQSLSVAIQ